MGKLRTANNRHKRALAREVAAKTAKVAPPAPVKATKAAKQA